MARIYREIKQSRAYTRSEEEFLVTLVYTTEVVRHALERALLSWLISPEQYNVLRILRGARPGGHPTLEIARRMISRSPNISRMIMKLISKGLVKRHRETRDQRVVLNCITARGEKVLASCDKAVAFFMKRVLARKGSGLKPLIRVLDEIRRRARVETARERMGQDRIPL